MTSNENIAYISLGSNKGDCTAFLSKAILALNNHNNIEILESSKSMVTKPVGVIDQPDFLNQVLKIKTTLEPLHLLKEIKLIENQMGRTPSYRWGPREIDIDILLYENASIDSKKLTIPHKELQNRPFLLNLLQQVSIGCPVKSSFPYYQERVG